MTTNTTPEIREDMRDPMANRKMTTIIIAVLIVFFFFNIGLTTWLMFGPGGEVSQLEMEIKEIPLINGSWQSVTENLDKSGLFTRWEANTDGSITAVIEESYAVPPESYDTYVVLRFSDEGYCIAREIEHRVREVSDVSE